MGNIPLLNAWNWFTNAQANIPTLTGAGYRPGTEIDGALGVYYNGWKFRKLKIAPLAQVLADHRWRDSGAAADSQNTGYDRILLAPGIEFDTARFRIYGDVGFPVYQFLNGNQIVAAEYYKVNIGYAF
jgi:hypothetical protein